MGIAINTLRAACEFYSRGYFDNMKNVCDLGCQEIYINKENFEKILKSYGINFNNLNFPNIFNDRSPYVERDSTKEFWKLLGFENHVCTDIEEKHDSIILDLNEEFKNKKFLNEFDLVTDFGNNEHPFNTAEAYRTMHRLCKKGGLLWINQFIKGGNGFYNYDLSYFESIAAVNKYEIIGSYLVVPLNPQNHENDTLNLPFSVDLIDLFDHNKLKNLGVTYIFKKTSDEDFIFPIQRVGMKDKNLLFKPTYLPEMTHLGISPRRAYIAEALSTKQAIKQILSRVKFFIKNFR